MKIRAKIIIFVILLLIGLPVGLFFSWCINTLLSGNTLNFSDFTISESIDTLKSDEKFRQLTLCVEIIITVGISAILLIKKRESYESDTVEITNNIRTPIAIGQGQHGTAWWLNKSEYTRTFARYKLNSDNKIFADLYEKGKNQHIYIGILLKDKKVHKIRRKQILQVLRKKDKVTPAVKVEPVAEKKVPIIRGKSKIRLRIEKTYSIVKEKIVTWVKTEISKRRDITKGGLVVHYEKHGKTEQIYYLSGDVHSLTIGTTGCGKSRRLVMQSIAFTAFSGESMLINDPKGELADYCTPYLKNLGYEVLCVDFKNPLKSDRYNFLQPIIDAVNLGDYSKAVDLVWDITSSLVEKSKHGEPIWTNGEMSVIAGAIMAVVFDNKERPQYQNFTQVYYFILNMCRTVKINADGKSESTMLINAYLKDIPNDHPAKGIFGVAQIAPERTRGSFFTAALATLRLFTVDNIYSMTRASDFVMADTGSKKRVIFLILPDQKTTFYGLASLFVHQHYIALTEAADKRGGRLERRVNFWLDEFGNFTVIPAFANMLTVSRGRGIRFNLFVQSLGQIEEKYGREGAQIIADNCHSWIYLKTADGDTAAKISKRLGHYTTSSYSRSSSYAHNSGGNSSNSMNLIARSLLTEDEIMLIERPYALVMYTGKHPAITRLPDLSKWHFNTALGLGNEEHNIKLREVCENSRVERASVRVGSDGTLNEIWESYETSDDFPVQEREIEQHDPPNLPNIDHNKFDNVSKYGDLAMQIIEDNIADTDNQLPENEKNERCMNL